ncbi:hypothetical protein AVEN_29048-1 [Araneus ventricosus]|uniref:Uncharacterized protein n=1 Tax=Araneus ventricosus TaxID=182803 RepID=A0A4Y2AJL7_ARAVE|nr:hypothetical protein AVEN_29048-1 [Araneus ventricosus]
MSGSRTSIWKLRKDDLILVVKEMGLTVLANVRFIDEKNLIENSDIYKNQLEVFQRIIDSVTERWQLEAERRKSEDEARESEIKAKLKIERAKRTELKKQLEIEIMKKHL